MQDFQSKKSDCKYCCPTKQYYIHEACNLGKSLSILPRIIIYKGSLKVHNIYNSTINVVNQGLYKRHLVYSTDSCDTTVQVFPLELLDNFLEPDQSLKIFVRIEPQARSKINRRRHVFITSQHPNITFAIPIIILNKADDNDISLPFRLIFPPTTVENFTYHEMIVYNKSNKKLQLNIKCSLPNLAVQAKSFNVKRNDYREILLKLYCQDCHVVDGCLKLKKINTGDNIDIPFMHEPLKWSLYVNTSSINFDCARFRRKRTKEFSICNESNRDIVFDMNFISSEETVKDDYYEETVPSSTQESQGSSTDLNNCTRKQMKKNMDEYSYKHFTFEPNCGTVRVNSTYLVKVTFCPIMHDNFLPSANDVSPFNVMSNISVIWKNETKIEKRTISLKGQIIGPEIVIFPEVLDLRHVYFGEEHCAQIKVLNKDDICNAHVNLYAHSNCHSGRIISTPKEGLTLKPNHEDIFQIQFYCTIVGKFLVKLEFKVKNGGKYSVIMKGYCEHVKVKCFPEILNLGVIPIAIPQKRFVLLMNPLAVAITVQCSVKGDGTETPLVLNTHNVKEHLPITVKDPFHYNQEYDVENVQVEENFEFIYDVEESEPSSRSFQSHTGNNSCCSSEFEKSALDLIPDMSHKLVSRLKAIKIFDKTEMENKVIEEALNVILKAPYFLEMDKYKNYTQMDWNSLATDPQEIYCNTEIIYLKPNTGKVISIVVIPNVVGCQYKHIELRVCPLLQTPSTTACPETTDLCQIVETNFMTCKFHIDYNCSVPEIIWDNVIIMEDDPLYAGEYYDFEMVFQNNNNFGGFFYYDVIPESSLGVMRFPKNKWKYFIEPDSKIHVPCQVKFTKLGFISLSGLLKFVGVHAGHPFHIKAHVLPPKINISHRSICEHLPVLQSAKLYIFIENVTPTSTWFKLKLKNESGMYIEPSGGQLAPNGQAMYATLNVYFKDPGIYKNILYIIMEFETIEKIPININVRGIPIFLEPEVRTKDLNVGSILCNMEEDNCEENLNFSKAIKIINKGLRCYRFNITLTKCVEKPGCSINSAKVKFPIKPNNLIVPPFSENRLNISISCSAATTFYSEFRMQLIDHNDLKHMESYRFSLSGTFIMPQLDWNKRDVTLNYYRTPPVKEHKDWETIKLTNVTQNKVDYVILKISGPFKIKELFKQKYENELNFCMAGLETKEFNITFNKEEIINRLSTSYEGSVVCSANFRVQKSVRIKLLVFVPEIILKQNKMTLFTKQSEGTTFIELTNTGEVPANYKWKKLKEEWRCISKKDDTELTQMLNSQFDPETSQSRRYQKYQCLVNDMNYSANIKEIINEVIDNLELDIQRYQLSYEATLSTDDYLKTPTKQHKYSTDHEALQNLQLSEHTHVNKKSIEDNLVSPTITFSDFNCETNSCKVHAASESSINIESGLYYTLDDISGHLKLEDSYEHSSFPSTETSEHIKSVYFFKKCGLLHEKQTVMCALHIPPINTGFEVRATFQIDVVGSNSQKLEIILVHLDKTVKLNKQHLYLGLRPWYERYRTKSYIENITNYQLSLQLNEVPVPVFFKHKLPKIALGFCNILGCKTLQLLPLQNTIVQTEGIMGFNEDFNRKINVIINDSEKETLELHGHGAMPMLIMYDPILPLLDQHPVEIIAEYRLLQELYYRDIFKNIAEKNEDSLDIIQEEISLYKFQTFLTNYTLGSTENLNESETAKPTLEVIDSEQMLLDILQSFVLVSNNNKDLPSRTLLYQLMQTEKFLNDLRYNSETSALLNMLYHNYLLHSKSYDEKILLNLKHFNLQSLPFHLRSNTLDMGKLYLNQYCKFLITLEFIGPGKLIAAARTAIKIPGLIIDFEIFENDEINNFIYFRADEHFTLCDKPYRNINERLLDRETNPKVKHAHSYDFDPLLQHQRTVNIMENKCLKNYYNSVNKSIYLEQKHHFTHCKIISKSKYTSSNTKMNVIIIFRPQKYFFEHNQNVEDYLYIDLHMGTTLPILLRALIIDKKRKEY